MKVLEVICARYDEDRHLMHLVREIEKADGSASLNLTVFSPALLAARAAQYEIDDIDELVDMILYGSDIEQVDPMSMSAASARNLHRERTLVAKAELTTKKKGSVDKETKLRSAGVHQMYIDALAEDTAEVVKRHCTPDPLEVRHLRQKARAKRVQTVLGQAVKHTNKVAARADMERQKAIMAAQRRQSLEQQKAKPTHVTVHLSKKSKTS